jgi:hypothetical protein
MAEDTPADKPDSHPGARAIPTVEERVAHIVGIMERLEWERGKTGPKLAAEWGVSLSVVEKASAEASRRCTADAEEVRRDISVGGRQLMRDAVRDGRAGDFTKVGELLASVSGAKAAEKHLVGALEGATPSKAREVMSELFGAVTPDAKPSDPER